MNSLQELNTFGSQTLTVDDAGNGSVVLDRYPFQIKDQNVTINSQTVNVIIPYNILSIINYASASARLKITLNTTGTPSLVSSLSFGTMPSYMNVSHISNVYTIVGLRQASDWNAIKNFTWNLASNYASCKNWYLRIELIWYEDGVQTTVGYSHYDLRYYYISQMYSESTVSSQLSAIRRSSSSISSRANLECAEGNTRLKTSGASLSASSSVYCNAIEFQRVNTIEVISTLTVIPTEIPKFTFLSNQKNTLSLPQIEDFGNGTDTYSYMVIVTSGQGTIGTLTSSSSSWLETGTRSYINNKLSNLYFYPTKDRTTNVSITIILSKNNTELWTRYDTIYYAGSGAIATTVYTFTSNSTWTPNVEQTKYSGLIDVLVVGGGGGGRAQIWHNGGGAGAGGTVTYQTNLAINSSETIVIGVGGAGGLFESSTHSALYGSNGTSSSISGSGRTITGAGGLGGRSTSYSTGPWYDVSGVAITSDMKPDFITLNTNEQENDYFWVGVSGGPGGYDESLTGAYHAAQLGFNPADTWKECAGRGGRYYNPYPTLTYNGTNAVANRGCGGGGAGMSNEDTSGNIGYNGGAGGSGLVVIRAHA